jgi:DeoR family transcriptional regulator of aga operon/DeoR family fructose operon transcriptional repressor
MPLAAERRVKILERVAEGMSIQVADLAREFGCSEMTIRRDIVRLERDGFLRRTYGGATAHLTRSLDVAFNARSLANAPQKRLIALTAVGLIGDARVLYVGIGTTAEHFARYLPVRPDLTIVTGSLPIASMLGTRSANAVVLGGNVRRDELSCVGPMARSTLDRYRFDLAVLGTAGLTARWGLTDLNDDEAEIHRIAIDRSERLIVIADGSKLGVVTSAVVAGASTISTLVTDSSASETEVAQLRHLGIDVVIAKPGSRRRAEEDETAEASPA